MLLLRPGLDIKLCPIALGRLREMRAGELRFEHAQWASAKLLDHILLGFQTLLENVQNCI